MNNNIKNNPLIIFGLAIIILWAVHFIPDDFTIFGISIKPVDIFSDIKTDEETENSDDTGMVNYNQNSISRAGFTDIYTLMNISQNFLDSEIEKIGENNSGLNISAKDLTGNTSQLSSFFNDLKNSKSKQVRIAHYGDSGIETDMVSADLREILQSKFGGKCVGFVPVFSEGVNYRQSINFDYSKSWEMFGVNSKNPDRLPVGISGKVFINNEPAFFEYSTKSRYKNSRDFDVVRLFYSNANSSTIYYSLNGKNKEAAKLESGSDLKVLEIKAPKSTSIRFEIPQAKQAYFYGISLESSNGVYVDNFALRGNTGIALRDIPNEIYKSFNKELDYRLILLQFGLNALSSRTGNYERYEKEMVKVINQIKRAFPDIPIIMIGASDRSVKKGADFVTDPSLEELITTQLNIAKAADVAYWNVFESMGGKNSMPNWVEHNPPLAYRDYIHFNEEGVKKIAEMFSSVLLKEMK
jgi:lysophospholipase L1-like esterase